MTSSSTQTTTHIFEAKNLHADGFNITYYDSVNEHEHRGETIVLIHGTGGRIDTHFAYIFPILATKYRVIGFNWVDTTAEGSQLEVVDLVAQTHSLLSAISPTSKNIVVGYSLGAVVAAAMAAAHPELVDQLVLISGWIQTDYQQQLRHKTFNALMKSSDPSGVKAWTVFSAFSTDFLLALPAEKLTALENLISHTEFSLKQMELTSRVNIWDAVKKISTPTLIVSANEDLMIAPHHQRQLFGAIENSRLARVNSGHACVYERAPELVHHILQFAEFPTHYDAGTIVPSPAP